MKTLEAVANGGFSAQDLEQLKNLGNLYTQAKALILYSEEIDPSARSNIQVIKELRDANDHLMRVLTARLCDVPPNGADELEYCKKNLDKAVGHIYRAAFDALDGTVLSLREKIIEVLNNYPLPVIKEVIPDYWELRTKLETLTGNVACHRAGKDVAGNVTETLNLYVGDTEQIKEFFNRIVQAGPALDAYAKKHKEEEKREQKNHLKIHIFGGLAYSAIGAIFGIFISQVITNKPHASEVKIHSPITVPTNSAPENTLTPEIPQKSPKLRQVK